MSRLLRAELIKLRTTRTFAGLVAAALLVSLLIVVLTTSLGEGFTPEDVRDLFTTGFTGLFVGLLGVMGMAGEWRHRTITATVLAAPDRLRLLGAKTIAYAIAGAVVALVVLLVTMTVGSLILSSRGEPTLSVADAVDVVWRGMAVAAAAGALGVCIGAIVRNQVAGVVGLLVGSAIVEPAVVALAPRVGRFGPLSGAPDGVLDYAFASEDLLAPGLALLVLVAWIAIAFAVAHALLSRRDVV